MPDSKDAVSVRICPNHTWQDTWLKLSFFFFFFFFFFSFFWPLPMAYGVPRPGMDCIQAGAVTYESNTVWLTPRAGPGIVLTSLLVQSYCWSHCTTAGIPVGVKFGRAISEKHGNIHSILSYVGWQKKRQLKCFCLNRNKLGFEIKGDSVFHRSRRLTCLVCSQRWFWELWVERAFCTLLKQQAFWWWLHLISGWSGPGLGVEDRMP